MILREERSREKDAAAWSKNASDFAHCLPRISDVLQYFNTECRVERGIAKRHLKDVFMAIAVVGSKHHARLITSGHVVFRVEPPFIASQLLGETLRRPDVEDVVGIL